MAQELLDSHGEAIMRQALVLALKGDAQMVRTLLGYILPRRQEIPGKIGALPVGSAAELSQSSEKVIKKVLSGQLSIPDALGVADLMDRHRQIIETEQLVARVRALELRQETGANGK